MKGTEAMIELLKSARSAGHRADYVLFDTWFSSPAQLIAVKKLGLDSIAMIKKSSRIYYEYKDEQCSIKKIFGICKKRPGRSRYLLSVSVTRRTGRTGSLSSAQTRIFPKMRSSGSMEKDGR